MTGMIITAVNMISIDKVVIIVMDIRTIINHQVIEMKNPMITKMIIDMTNIMKNLEIHKLFMKMIQNQLKNIN